MEKFSLTPCLSTIKKLSAYKKLETVLLTLKNWRAEKDGIDVKTRASIYAFGIIRILLISWLFYDNIFVSILFLPYLYSYIMKEIQKFKKKMKIQKGIQFKDGMQAVSFALSAGYSVENAFAEAIGDLENIYPDREGSVTRQFKLIVVRLRRGENLENILMDYGNDTGVEDIRYFAEIFRYAKRSGGNIISIIKSAVQNMSEKQDIRNEIENVISGKKFEGQIMSGVPVFMLIYLRLSMSDFVSVLYGNALGVCIMTICLLVYLIAVKLSEKIVDIEV